MTLKEKMEAGQFVVLGEFEPPKGSDFSKFLANANLVKGRIDAFLVPEMANAVMKASSLGGCAFLQNRGFEPVLQACCRDRNRLALQADILAASALGITNIMAVNGVDISLGDHHQARAVHDLDLIGLLNGIRGLENGRDMAGIELKGKPNFYVGSTLNTGATGGAMDLELEELSKRAESGVEFVVTTPVFDLFRFRQLLKRIDTNAVKILPTVLLLKSAGMARYIERNIRHISVPPDTIRSIQKAPDKVRQCIRIASETIRGLQDMGVAGVMVSTMGWEDKLPNVLNEAGL